MYLIAREYEVPREDKQKIFGIQQVGDYCKQVMQAIKVQSWQDLLALEKQFPGTMGLTLEIVTSVIFPEKAVHVQRDRNVVIPN